MLVNRGSARFHKFTPVERDIAPGRRFEQPCVVFCGDAFPFVPTVDDHNMINSKVSSQITAAGPTLDDTMDGVCACHGHTL